MTEFETGNIYYVRAYATNLKGTEYGVEVICDFEIIMPVVTTQEATNVSMDAVTLNGTIVSTGDPVFTEKGFVYSTERNPTIEQATKIVVTGSERGQYFAYLSGLTTETLYYARAYAINDGGTVYGNEISFNPHELQYVVLEASGLMVQKWDLGRVMWITASDMCYNSTLEGYTDWRLPTIDELAILYNERATIGGFYSDYYWSSTASSNGYHWQKNFSSGGHGGYNDNNDSRCRCVRKLP
jgi:hypothetical protein